MPKILIASDTYKNQVNGVVTTMKYVSKYIKENGYNITWLSPDTLHNFIFPFYKDIKIIYPDYKLITDIILSNNFDYIHIVTEGPVGLITKLVCDKYNLNYTTSYHTKFPEYIQSHFYIPPIFTRWYFKWFHKNSKKVLVPTQSLITELKRYNFNNLVVWKRGVDCKLFNPTKRTELPFDKNNPKWLYVGRISYEKNIKEFLDINIIGEKTIVGDGPQLKELQKLYPDVKFTGNLSGEQLVKEYANNDIFVFPSYTDTYGIVILEAIASGLLVATQPLEYISEIITELHNGSYEYDLKGNMEECLDLRNDVTIDEVSKTAWAFSWDNIGKEFLNNLVNVR